MEETIENIYDPDKWESLYIELIEGDGISMYFWQYLDRFLKHHDKDIRKSLQISAPWAEQKRFYESCTWKSYKRMFRDLYDCRFCFVCKRRFQPHQIEIHHRYPIVSFQSKRRYMNIEHGLMEPVSKKCHKKYHEEHPRTVGMTGYVVFEGTDFFD